MATESRDQQRLVAIEAFLDGRTNMARDVELLQASEQGQTRSARVYSWDGPWVSLGRFQRPERALLDPLHTRWVVRPTGGKAVLHGHDVTVGMAASLSTLGINEIAARRVSTVYRAIVGPLVESLNAAGISAVLAEDTRHVRNPGHTADCFAHVSPNDVVDPLTGEKVCGCALRVTESAVLLQASVPVGRPLVEPSTVFDSPHTASSEKHCDVAALIQSLRTNWLARGV